LVIVLSDLQEKFARRIRPESELAQPYDERPKLGELTEDEDEGEEEEAKEEQETE
jgi:hypothetical protein